MTEKKFQDFLFNYYKRAYYFIPNVYFFGNSYGETDVLIVNKNGFIYDIEIKLTKSDYKADFKKKRKHFILKNGYFKLPHYTSVLVKGKRKRFKAGEKIPTIRPNRFFYCVPEGLIKKSDLPDYAGLLYIDKNGYVKKIKEGKLLHKEKIEYEKPLLRKLYFRLLNCLS